MNNDTFSANAVLGKLYQKRVKIYLVNGIALTGVLQAYDDEALLLSPQTLVFRDHVSTVHLDHPKRTVTLPK